MKIPSHTCSGDSNIKQMHTYSTLGSGGDFQGWLKLIWSPLILWAAQLPVCQSTVSSSYNAAYSIYLCGLGYSFSASQCYSLFGQCYMFLISFSHVFFFSFVYFLTCCLELPQLFFGEVFLLGSSGKCVPPLI